MKIIKISIISIYLLISGNILAQKSEKNYLSGTDAENTKTWQFYSNDGMNSKKWTTIEVPSCWEQQGFGQYNYGHVPFDNRLKEQGHYKLEFLADANWKRKNVQLVFEGVMTDCEVILNGKEIGQHQGAFYEFQFDVSKFLKIGQKNILEVKVKKHSENESINQAERKADFWIFGGIFRPVYLMISPDEHISHVAIDAKSDGSFKADITIDNLDETAQIETRIQDFTGNVKAIFNHDIKNKFMINRVEGKLENPKLWSAEFPNRYIVVFKIFDKSGDVIHEISKKIGFRTIEVREADGIFVNGEKIKFKGVNRHTFHPDYGRTSSEKFSVEAVNLIKDMNMNAVRSSHYPPDKHFINACDSLGLFVLDELSGWQEPSYDTQIGKKLLREMINRDVNSPSILFWINGNEGGWNRAYDKEFTEVDIQKREVLHPWGPHEKTITSHYVTYDYLSFDHFEPRKIFFPTEFLHGLYDGGHGAGLDDYWQKMWNHPLSAGGFLWVLADEAIKRTDTGKLDSDGNHAPDGILGPYNEKEGSFFTIKEIWSPIKIDEKFITPNFKGEFSIENRFHFTNLNDCSLEVRWFKVSNDGSALLMSKKNQKFPKLNPLEKGVLKIGMEEQWQTYDFLELEATDPHGRSIYTWSFPVKTAKKYFLENYGTNATPADIVFGDIENVYSFKVAGIDILFDKSTGLVKSLSNGRGDIPLTNGPVLVGNYVDVEKVSHRIDDNIHKIETNYKGDIARTTWSIHPNGLVHLDIRYRPKKIITAAGVDFSFPEEEVKSIKWLGNGPYRVWKNRLKGAEFNIWEKKYNNTITGHSGFDYPEFKGFHSNIYWVGFNLKNNQSFKVHTTTNDLYLKLFNPEEAPEPEQTHVNQTSGDISFLNGIPPIGTKFNSAESLGPQSMPYSFAPKRVSDGFLQINLIFDFR
jgi:hypothetical protein